MNKYFQMHNVNHNPERIFMLFGAFIFLGFTGGCMIIGDEVKDGQNTIKIAM